MNCNSKSKPKQRFHKFAGLTAFLAVGLGTLWACGPDFPVVLLNEGSKSFFSAPLADFFDRVASLGTPKPVPKARIHESSPEEQTRDAALADLAKALERTALPRDQRTAILRKHGIQRGRIADYQAALQTWRLRTQWDENAIRPPQPDIRVTAGLPREFEFYFHGAIAWHDGKKDAATQAWRKLLELPEDKRPFRSTWAAYMLGRALMDTNPDAARERFQSVRKLADKGFHDSTGLAAASLGWEARIEFDLKNHARAMELYLDQLAGGDRRAAASLRRVVSAWLDEDTEALLPAARDARMRSVFSSYLLSSWFSVSAAGSGARLGRWLEALEREGVDDPTLAESMAVAAYRGGDFAGARRWIDRAGKESIAARWILAKLHLRDGDEEAAARIYAALADRFPVDGAVHSPKGALLADRSGYGGSLDAPIANQIQGEFALIQLSRRDYVNALHSLMRFRSWQDAAHVAEKVLTLEELRAYVDRHWPPRSEQQGKPDVYGRFDEPFGEPVDPRKIRGLLGRRLMRAERWDEAVSYLPSEMRSQARRLAASLKTGRDETVTDRDRAEALWRAAFILRYDGLGLIATETEPDWRIHQGNYEHGVNAEARFDPDEWPLFPPAAEEAKRVAAAQPSPNKRFHYRHAAANLGWQAAQLMPDNDPETARVLCLAGSWLKNRDPKSADRFYKALVNRCPETELGRRADQLRWFPAIGKTGGLVP